jgi:hypothetical protein
MMWQEKKDQLLWENQASVSVKESEEKAQWVKERSC